MLEAWGGKGAFAHLDLRDALSSASLVCRSALLVEYAHVKAAVQASCPGLSTNDTHMWPVPLGSVTQADDL